MANYNQGNLCICTVSGTLILNELFVWSFLSSSELVN